jgi:sec-independent protein translocase protein TatB
MFGIGLPELILIMAIALVVVGPEKLPELARSLGKGIVELKKAAASIKDSLEEEEEKTPAWGQEDMDQHPNKLLEAYNNLPEGVTPGEDAPAISDAADDDSETTGSTEEISRDQSAAPETESTEDKNKV